jgi:hypothetical protein
LNFIFNKLNSFKKGSGAEAEAPDTIIIGPGNIGRTTDNLGRKTFIYGLGEKAIFDLADRLAGKIGQFFAASRLLHPTGFDPVFKGVFVNANDFVLIQRGIEAKSQGFFQA